MSILYRLQSGKISRLNSEGVREIHVAPYDFVPSPTELEANKFRLEAVGKVSDDSDEVKAALKNTSQQVKKAPAKVQTMAEDIRKAKDLNAALSIVRAAKDEVMLDKYLLQESENKPRPRKTVLAAIEERRDEIAGMPPDKSSTAEVTV